MDSKEDTRPYFPMFVNGKAQWIAREGKYNHRDALVETWKNDSEELILVALVYSKSDASQWIDKFTRGTASIMDGPDILHLQKSAEKDEEGQLVMNVWQSPKLNQAEAIFYKDGKPEFTMLLGSNPSIPTIFFEWSKFSGKQWEREVHDKHYKISHSF